MVKTTSTDELKTLLDNKKQVYLIDTLNPKSYEARHIPTAKSLPYAPNFVELFEKNIGANKDDRIVMYCMSDGCQLSDLAAQALEQAGYNNVYHYEDGLAGWQDAGYEFET